ncbi:MAG: hypothetical protein JWO65_1716 [Sphingomonas bacterium]|nr:hypothetical protein [Sphingomonas bacterium]
MADDRKDGSAPDPRDPPEDFRPEGAEWEPAGGVVKKPPAPEEDNDPPTEGDKR